MAAIHHYECIDCGTRIPASRIEGVCVSCRGPLVARYDLTAIRETWHREALTEATVSLWRYAEVLPEASPVSLGEGFTPLLRSRVHPGVLIKDEGRNPAGSVYARSASVTVSVARTRGMRRLTAQQDGDAAVALSAYCAAAGIGLDLSIPATASEDVQAECELLGAQVTPVSEAGSWPGDFAAFQPFVTEGLKTLAYEIVEQLGWHLPEAIVWPGPDLAVIAIVKAIDELHELGWVAESRFPKLFTLNYPEMPARTTKFIRDSGGQVLTVTADEITSALRSLAAQEGILASPEGASSLAMYRKLLAGGVVRQQDMVVLVNTGSGQKYPGPQQKRSWMARPKSRSIGGIIQPY